MKRARRVSGALGPGAAVHRRHRPVRRGQVARDSRARGPRLLLRRQPADRADSRRSRSSRSAGAARSRRAAVVVDVREGRSWRVSRRLPAAEAASRRRASGCVFLEAADSALLRRFSETRRPHPLGDDRVGGRGHRAKNAACCSRSAVWPIRSSTRAALTVHELRRRDPRIDRRRRVASRRSSVTIVSFGFRRGVPADADLVFDVRFLPNPHFVPSLRRWSGRDSRVWRATCCARRRRGGSCSSTTALLKFLRAAVHRRRARRTSRSRSAARAAGTGRWPLPKRWRGGCGACEASSCACAIATSRT